MNVVWDEHGERFKPWSYVLEVYNVLPSWEAMGKLRTVAAAPYALIGRPSLLEVYEEIVFDVKPTRIGEGKTKGGW